MSTERTIGGADEDLGAVRLAARRRWRRRWWLRLIGAVLIGYGLSGIFLFVLVARAIDEPLDEAVALTDSIEDQRSAVLESLDLAVTTIEETANGVRNMDLSLAQARVATDSASQLATNMAASMYELRNQMGISVFGLQPLIGLAPGFDQTGRQMELLSADVAAIGEALNANREDAASVADSMEDLGDSVHSVATTVREGPRLAVTTEALASLRLGILAMVIWLVLLAGGCLLAGLTCWSVARRA